MFLIAGIADIYFMPTNKKPFSIRRWVAFTFAGWVAGVAILLLIAGIAEAVKLEGQWMVGLGMALGVSCLQWVELRKHISRSSQWIWTSTTGMFIPWVAADTLRYFLHFKPDDQVLPATIAGACLAGWLQWRYVWRGANTTAPGWVLVTLAAWTLATLAVIPLGYYNRIQVPKWLVIPLAFFTLFSGGIILGMVTGWKLKRMLPAKQGSITEP